MIRRPLAFTVLTCAMLALANLGCGGGSSGPRAPVTAPPASTAEAKKMLDDYAASGSLSSSIGALRQSLEELKKTDSTKGTELLGELDKLEKMTSPADIKKQAAAMSAKL